MPKSPLPFEDRSDEERRPHRVGRGFFAVLALCLIAIGGVAASTFSQEFETPTVSDTAPTTSVPTTARTTDVAAAAPTRAPTTTATTVKTTAATTVTTAPAALWASPLNGERLTPFSEQPQYSETMADYRAHLGIDIDGEEGQSVRALAAGTVASVEDDPLWGTCITVEHGEGIVSVYRGVRCTVSVGSHLEVGHELGKLAAVPCEAHLGPHLHLELYRAGTPVDPATLLGDLL